jgi:hypothetical protein
MSDYGTPVEIMKKIRNAVYKTRVKDILKNGYRPLIRHSISPTTQLSDIPLVRQLNLLTVVPGSDGLPWPPLGMDIPLTTLTDN